MKNLITIFVVLISITALTNAQIPNYDFEIWESYSDPDNSNNVYQRPSQWLGLLPTSPSTYSFSIEKNAESYPPESGEYSMIIKSDITNGVDGVALSYGSYPNDLEPDYFPPAFPIDYRPASLFLYYKYLPVDGDSMHVVGSFYKNRVLVGELEYSSPQVVSEWTLLEAPISYSTSETPDSASIVLMTFYYTQHSGSELYIDNLSFDTPITAIDENTSGALPKSFALMQNYPNPFNPSTTINYSIPSNLNSEAVNTKLIVYDVLGRKVTTLVNKAQKAGNYEVRFNARNLSSGVYIYRLESGNFRKSIKMILLK